MSSIDERVVSMKFDNAQFERGVKTTIDSLSALNKGLQLEGATKGFHDVQAAANKFSLAHIAQGVDALVGKFKALSIAGITALTNIVNRAVDAGITLTKSLTIDPIKAGLEEYELNLNSIQTILANTQWEGKGLKDVNKALDELNKYSDQTIYNFAEMTRNIGTFTAAGVKLDTSVAAIKGIANLAAISGSNAQQAASAMYQLSQALATGKVALIDWNSVVNAGMGGKVFQDAIMETARVHGVAIDKIIKDAGSFRDSLQEGWFTSDILLETLAKFTGDLTESQLRAMGYNEQQIAGIIKLGQTAQDAATKVKTVSQLINTLQESVTSGWAQTWQLLFGDFEEAKELFTNVNDVIGGFINASSEARNKVVGDWKELGGRTVLIEAISNAFNGLISVVKPIKDAFRQIFPAATGKQLYDLTVALRNFTENFKMGAENADRLRRTFAGVFAVLGIVWDIVKEVAKTFLRLFGIAADGSGNFLELTAKVGDFLVGIRQAIKDGNVLTKFFEKLGDILALPIKALKAIGAFFSTLFKDFDGAEAAKDLTGFIGKLEILGRLGDVVSEAWDKVIHKFDEIFEFFGPLASKMANFFGDLSRDIASAIQNVDFQDVLGAVNTGLFAALVLGIRNLINNFKGGDSILDSVKDAFEGITDTLGAMQNTLRAATLLQIAAAVAVLTVSVVALSKIDSEGLTRALTAMTVMFTQLFSSMAIFEKVAGMGGFAKMPLVTASMILLGVAVNILAGAVKKLADLDWDSLVRGLTGVSVVLGVLVAAVRLMPDDKSLISSSLGLILLAAAVKVLASAVTDLSGLSWEEMAKGLVGVGTLLAALTLFTRFADADKGGISQGIGILLLAAAIKLLADAVTDLSKLSWEDMARGLAGVGGGLALIAGALKLIPPQSLMPAAAVFIVAASLSMIGDAVQNMSKLSWEEIARGLVTMAGSLLTIAAALNLIPPSSLLSAAAVLVVASSLGMISDALKDMASMSWEEIAKGLVTLAGALGIIAGAMALMSGALVGAAALLVVAGSLAIIAPILITFGQMSWEEIGKGLLMLAGVFVVLGAAGLLLTPVVPTLLGLGVAVVLLGAGMLAAGVGVLAFAAGLTALSVAGTAGAAAIVGIVSALIGLIPMVMEQIGLGIIAFAEVIATAGPAITKAITTVLLALIDAIVILTPRIIDALLQLLAKLLESLEKAVPKMVQSGYNILIGILDGIKKNIHKVVDTATDVIVEFLDGIGDNIPKIQQAAADLIIDFIESMADTIRNNSERMGKAGNDLATAIIEGVVKGLSSATGLGKIADAAKNAAKAALNAAKKFLGIASPSKEFIKIGQYSDEGFAKGIRKYSPLVEESAEDVGGSALTALRKTLATMPDLLKDDINLSPTITPVLDLSQVKQSASEIDDVFDRMRLSIDGSFDKANRVSAMINQGNQTDTTEEEPHPRRYGQLVFNQYNTSPKALSAAEIYRQTRNQLSVAKGALNV